MIHSSNVVLVITAVEYFNRGSKIHFRQLRYPRTPRILWPHSNVCPGADLSSVVFDASYRSRSPKVDWVQWTLILWTVQFDLIPCTDLGLGQYQGAWMHVQNRIELTQLAGESGNFVSEYDCSGIELELGVLERTILWMIMVFRFYLFSQDWLKCKKEPWCTINVPF